MFIIQATAWDCQIIGIREQVAWNKSSLLLTIILQNTQILQQFTKTIKQKLFTKVNNLTSWMAWVEQPAGLIKRGRKCKRC
jgi:hypothetical protein